MNGNGARIPVVPGVALLVAGALLPVAPAMAGDPPEVDTSKWTCKFCPEDEGFKFTPELGAGYVSDASAKFGEYTGLNDEGAYAVADADGRYRNKDGLWLDLSAVDLGLDSRYIGVEGGKQGQYQLHLSYKQLPHNISDTAVSPFIGSGTDSLSLPTGWVSGSTTDAMTALGGSLRGVDLETERRLFDLGASVTSVAHWAFAVNVRHEEKTGTRGTGGSFVFNDSQLAMPVDYKTDQFDASAAYNTRKFQARIAYYGSIFRNDDSALLWTNPYLPFASGTNGQLALAPGNEFHQLVLSGGYQIAARTQVTGDIALGRMSQDDAFLSYTVNTGLPTQPLPRSSLDGRVETLTGNLKFTTALADELRVNASLSYNDRNNQTPQAAYDWITTDSAVATPRTNLPYSFTRSVAEVDAAFTATRNLRIYAGCTIDDFTRDYQQVDHTNDGSCWGKASVRAKDVADISLMYTHGERTGSHYQPNPDDTPAQNPLMRLYDMADRNRDEVKLRVDATPAATFNIGLDVKATWDSYFNSTIGLLDGNSWSAAADCAWMFTTKASATCYLGREQIKSRQANAEMLAPSPLWTGENTDTIDTAGVGLKYGASEKFDFGLDYTYSRSTGEVVIQSATVGFPDLTTRLNSARLYLNYSPRKKFSMRMTYWYESYRSEDWALDGVLPATIDNVLALGQASPTYDVNVITLSGRYEF